MSKKIETFEELVKVLQELNEDAEIEIEEGRSQTIGSKIEGIYLDLPDGFLYDEFSETIYETESEDDNPLCIHLIECI